MTDKEFRRLSRAELVDIIFELQKREQDYLRRLNEAESLLRSRELKVREAGSIAEATLTLHDVFVSAQAAADHYVEEIKRIRDSAQAEADRALREAGSRAKQLLADAELQAKHIVAEAKAEADALRLWTEE